MMHNSKEHKTLYIIGNGFDIHHSLNTKYSDFKAHLINKNRKLHDRVEQFLFGIEDYWWNFEEALSYLDTDQIIDVASNSLVSYGADDWSDAYHHSYQFEIGAITGDLSSNLKEEFLDWITEIDIHAYNSRQRLKIDTEALFLTFNYTTVLQEIYNVNSNNILHIHGSTEDCDLILGHGWEPTETSNEYDEYDDHRVIEGQEIIQDYFERTFKPTATLIEQNQSFFDQLDQIERIVVLGHSLSDVDMPYFETIVVKTNHNKPFWHTSYYHEEEKQKHSQTISALGISPRHTSLFTLNEILEYSD